MEREIFEKHREFLEEHVELDFGLLDKLIQNDALSGRDVAKIEAKDNMYERNSVLLSLVSIQERHDCLIEALKDASQSHIVNYLKGNGEYTSEFAGDWPLTKREKAILRANREFFVDNLDMDDLLGRLYATGVINKRQREFISSKPTSYEKNKAFVDILSRHSLRGYWQTILCLQDSNQKHIATVLDQGGVVVRAVVSVEGEAGVSNRIERETASQINTLLDNLSQEEGVRVLNELLQLRLILAATSHSVALYFHCLSLDEVKRLKKVAKNGKLKKMVETVFSRLLSMKEKVRVNLDGSYKDSCSHARNYFSIPLSWRLLLRPWNYLKDKSSAQRRVNASETVFMPTSLDRLPTEVFDVILQKCYLQFCVNSSNHFQNVDVITDLASVNYRWSKRIISRRIKRKIWGCTKVSCQRFWKRFTVCRNIQQYLLENIHTKGLLKQLRSTGCLTDKEMRQVNRFKCINREFNRNTDLLHLTMLLDNDRFSTFWQCLRNTQQNLSATALAHGRAAVKSYIKTNEELGNIRSFMTQKIANTLNTLRDTSKFSPHLQQLYDRFRNIGVEFLHSTTDRDIVFWIWCSSNSSLQKLRKFSESNDLREELSRLISLQFSTNIVEHVSSTETEHFEDYAVIIGLADGDKKRRHILKLNLHRPSEIHNLPEIPTPGGAVTAAVYQNIVYVVGLGECRNEIWKNDSKSGWEQCSSLVRGRSLHSVAFMDEVLYVCGGYVYMYVHQEYSVLDCVEAYNTVSNTCSSVGKLVIACDRSAICTYKKSLYIFGGCGSDKNELSDVQVYNTTQNTCHLLSKPMPRGYSLMRALTWQDSVIILGCFNCFMYNFENDTWQTREHFRTYVSYFGLAFSNNRIYVIGGGTPETDGRGKTTWRYRDDVKSVSIINIFENKPDTWKFHVKLSQPYLVIASGVIGSMTADVNASRDVLPETLQDPAKLYASNEYLGLIKTINIDRSQFTKTVGQDLTEYPASLLSTTFTEDFAIIVGLDDGQEINREVLQINLHRSKENHYLEEVPTSMEREATAVVYHNTVFVVGIGRYSDEIWKYEYNSGWNKCTYLYQRRRRHSAAFVDEVLYICGGYDDEDKSVLSSVEAYNADNNICQSVGKLLQPCRSSGNCVSYKKSLYIFGGIDEDDKDISDVQVYDTKQSTCQLLPKPMPCASRLMRAAVWRESVILLGYQNCFLYDFMTETWQVREQFKTNVVHFGLALSNDRIYVMGGGSCTTDANGKDTWTYRGDVRSFAIEKIIENKPVEWKVHAKLPKPCMVHALGVCNGTDEDDNLSRNDRRDLFSSRDSLGSTKAINSGEDTDNVLIIGLSDGSNITNEVLKINLNNPSEMYYVEEVPTFLEMDAAAAVYHNTLYVVGLGKYTNEIWKYEYNSGWNRCTNSYQRRRRHSVAFVDEVLYICGGFGVKNKTALDSVEAYDAVTNTCTSVGKLVYPCHSSGNCVSYEKSLYIFGGVDQAIQAVSYVQVYDTVQNTCHLLQKPMPKADYFMRAALWRDSVILVGSRICLTYDFLTEMWQVSEQFKTNVDHFGLAVSNDRIYVIGGGTLTTEAQGKVTWARRDDLRSVAIEKIIENKPVEWKFHAKLPKPCLVQAFAVMN